VTIAVPLMQNGIANTLTLTANPASTDTVFFAAVSPRTPPRNIATITGYGCTWTKVYGPVGSRVSWWMGVNAANTTPIQITWDAAHVGQFVGAWITQGLPGTTVVGAEGGDTTGTSLAGGALTAGPGQLVLSVMASLLGTSVSWPSVSTIPTTGYTAVTAFGGGGSSQAGQAYRIPALTETHRTDVTSTPSGLLKISTIVVGAAAPGPSLLSGTWGLS
jgi:hypothetical protein